MAPKTIAWLKDIPAAITSLLLLAVLGVLLASAALLKTTWDICLGGMIGLAFAQSVAVQDWAALHISSQRPSEQWEMLGETAEQRRARRCSRKAQARSPSFWSLDLWLQSPQPARSSPVTRHKASLQPHWLLLLLTTVLWNVTCGAFTIGYAATMRDRHRYLTHHHLHHRRSSWTLIDSHVKISELHGAALSLLGSLLALQWIIAAALIGRVGIVVRERKGRMSWR